MTAKWNLDEEASTDSKTNDAEPATTYFEFNERDHPEAYALTAGGCAIREYMKKFPSSVNHDDFGADIIATFAPVVLPESMNHLAEGVDLADRSTINAEAIKWVLDEAGELNDETADALIDVINASRASEDDEGDDN